jgi:hypothetical protein
VRHRGEKPALGLVGGDGAGALLLEFALGVAQLADGGFLREERAAEIEGVDDVPAQHAQRAGLVRGQLARRAVDDAERTERVPFRVDQRRAGVEADARRADDIGVVGEPGVARRIRHDEKLVVGTDGVRAEGDIPAGLALLVTLGGLEPLARLVDQRDERDRRPADLGREGDDVIVFPLEGGVEDAVGVQ